MKVVFFLGFLLAGKTNALHGLNCALSYTCAISPKMHNATRVELVPWIYSSYAKIKLVQNWSFRVVRAQNGIFSPPWVGGKFHLCERRKRKEPSFYGPRAVILKVNVIFYFFSSLCFKAKSKDLVLWGPDSALLTHKNLLLGQIPFAVMLV